jgi:hypothetical protein
MANQALFPRMKTPFGDIARAMMRSRDGGKTFGMIKGAPQGAILLASNAAHAQFLRERATVLARHDLRVETVTATSLFGRNNTFVPDHFTVEQWLVQADIDIHELRVRAETAEAELEKLKAELAALKTPSAPSGRAPPDDSSAP